MQPKVIFRSGIGFDVHKVEHSENPENNIVLGGVYIKHNKAIIAHSDGDILVHAIMDAMLGACGLNDIGYYFPPQDAKYRGANSMLLLQEVRHLMIDRKCELINIDTVIMCESPKILPYRDSIKTSLASVLYISHERIGVKATTTEKLGFIGRNEGIAVQAIATIMETIAGD